VAALRTSPPMNQGQPAGPGLHTSTRFSPAATGGTQASPTAMASSSVGPLHDGEASAKAKVITSIVVIT
jgi:hypothetical protein